MTKQQLKSLASRYSFDDWSWLCTQPAFEYVANMGAYQAQTLACHLIAQRDRVAGETLLEDQGDQERLAVLQGERTPDGRLAPEGSAI